MKVLWFSNTPSLAEEKFTNKSIGGGWIKSLEREIKKQKDIKLGVGFYYTKRLNSFEFNKTIYYPIFNKPEGKLKKVYNRFRGNLLPSYNNNELLEIIKDFRPDIIHIHGTEESFGLIQKEVKNIPIVISIQGNITVYNYKWFSGISTKQVSKNTSLLYKILFKDYNSLHKVFSKRAEREKEILSLTKNVIGRTDWDKRITSVMAPNNKYFHNDEILRDSFYKLKWKNNLVETINIFTTNGNNIYKGIEVILQAARLLDEVGFKFKWYVAGLSKNDSIIKLTERAFEVELSKNIIFEGKLNEKELINKLLASHVYVMPSHIENSPNNLCEAMILGVPCIATCAGGTSSLLTDGKEGILIQDGDPWSMAGAIIEMYNNYDIAVEYGENARKRALERHDPDKIVNDLVKIYKDIIHANKK